MAEQTSTSNPTRPALFKVVAGSILKGSRVELLGTTDQKPLTALKPTDRLAVREYTDFPRRDQTLREATVLWRNVERAWRTKDEEQLGREFTADEAAERERLIHLRVAEHQVGYHRDVILAKMESIANSLERACQDVRHAAEQSEHYGLASAVSRVQHDVAWLFPNLGADTLTSSLVELLRMETEVKRLGGPSEGAENQ
jgi:hypothetical protein